MAQVFRLFCFAISVLLFLQLADAEGPEKSPSKGIRSNRVSRKMSSVLTSSRDIHRNLERKYVGCVQDIDTKSNGQDGEENKPTFLKTVDKVIGSRPVVIAKELTSIAGDHWGKFSKDFESTLRAETEKQVSDENSFIPSIFQNNVVLPAKAFAQTSANILREPVGKMMTSVQKTYADELTKSQQDGNYVPIIGSFTKKANKPIALLKASSNVVGNTFGGILGTASSIWNLGKKQKAEGS